MPVSYNKVMKKVLCKKINTSTSSSDLENMETLKLSDSYGLTQKNHTEISNQVLSNMIYYYTF